jgi:hypothetical protein
MDEMSITAFEESRGSGCLVCDGCGVVTFREGEFRDIGAAFSDKRLQLCPACFEDLRQVVNEAANQDTAETA